MNIKTETRLDKGETHIHIFLDVFVDGSLIKSVQIAGYSWVKSYSSNITNYRIGCIEDYFHGKIETLEDLRKVLGP